MRITMNEELAEESSAKEIVGHLLLSCAVAWVLGLMMQFPFKGGSFAIGALLYIVYLGYKMAMIQASKVNDIRAIAELADSDMQGREVTLTRLASALESKAEAVNKKASALESDALAYKSQATAMQKLSDDRRMLNESMRVLSDERQVLTDRLQVVEQNNATAMQNLADAYKKKEATLLANSELLEKQVNSYKKAESKRIEEEERAKIEASVSRSFSSFGKSHEKMNAKYNSQGVDWRKILGIS